MNLALIKLKNRIGSSAKPSKEGLQNQVKRALLVYDYRSIFCPIKHHLVKTYLGYKTGDLQSGINSILACYFGAGVPNYSIYWNTNWTKI